MEVKRDIGGEEDAKGRKVKKNETLVLFSNGLNEPWL